MFRLNFKPYYPILHVTNEIGRYVIGGMGTYINELYRYRESDMGFVHMNDLGGKIDLDLLAYPGQTDILSLECGECGRLGEVDFGILVIHFYELAFCASEEILRGRKLVYVIHSVPLPEPPPKQDPFGGYLDIQEKFEFLCTRADLLICVSEAEKERLCGLYPALRGKTAVVHNGMTFPIGGSKFWKEKEERKVFGYLGRMDYRKGIMECFRAFRKTDAQLYLACPRNDPYYLESLLLYREAAGMEERISFLGWCEGERKEAFLGFVDALVVPSLYEPFGYVVLEAAARGVPVLAGSRGGMAEILGDYRYQFDPCSEAGLYDILCTFRTDSTEVVGQEMERLRERLTYFRAETMMMRYRTLYQRLLTEREA